MPPRLQVVQRVEDDIEFLKPVNVELRVLDVRMVRFELDVGIESSGGVLCDLRRIGISKCGTDAVRISSLAHQRLRLLNMLVAKEKLTVQITEVDCIQIDDVNLAEASKNKVLEQLATNAACSN